ncbi:HD domain-containing protein [Ideonella sp. DXS29W]|uniref:HD domain-containing protein n=1 Tax=Ideonella lacteola TaxID=2984193 RepID=A0ABU9BPR7_9BURK
MTTIPPRRAIDAARAFAMAAHGDQRYGSHPYVVHLEAVAAIAAPFGETAQVVAYLHDTVEDTAVSLDEVHAQFGELVAGCVALLTDVPGETRQIRKAMTYAKLAAVDGELELALVVKVADRLANVRACVADAHERLLRVYAGEHAAFKSAAYRSGLCDALWAELDTLLS